MCRGVEFPRGMYVSTLVCLVLLAWYFGNQLLYWEEVFPFSRRGCVNHRVTQVVILECRWKDQPTPRCYFRPRVFCFSDVLVSRRREQTTGGGCAAWRHPTGSARKG